jgi:hypothetical protein
MVLKIGEECMPSSNLPSARNWQKKLALHLAERFTNAIVLETISGFLRDSLGVNQSTKELKRAKQKKLLTTITPDRLTVFIYIMLLGLSIVSGVIAFRLLSTPNTTQTIYGNFLLNISTDLFVGFLVFLCIDILLNRVSLLLKEIQKTADLDLQNAERKLENSLKRYDESVIRRLGFLKYGIPLDPENPMVKEIPENGWITNSDEILKSSKFPDWISPKVIGIRFLHLQWVNDCLVFRLVLDDDVDYDVISSLDKIDFEMLSKYDQTLVGNFQNKN